MKTRTLGILTVSTLLVSGCAGPTEPRPTSSAFLPVVTSVENNTDSQCYCEWILHGSRFEPDPKVTFESGGSVISLDVMLTYPDANSLGVGWPGVTPPGTYTPCVQTANGKGCGTFLVTVK